MLFSPFPCYSNDSISCYIGNPILLLKEVTGCTYSNNIKTILSMESFLLFWVTLVCGILAWVPGQGWDDIFILLCILFNVFEYMNVSLVVKVFPYFYCFRTDSAILMSLCWQFTLCPQHATFWQSHLLHPVWCDLLFRLSPVHVFSVYVFAMLKVLQTFKTI